MQILFGFLDFLCARFAFLFCSLHERRYWLLLLLFLLLFWHILLDFSICFKTLLGFIYCVIHVACFLAVTVAITVALSVAVSSSLSLPLSPSLSLSLSLCVMAAVFIYCACFSFAVRRHATSAIYCAQFRRAWLIKY